MTETVYQVLAAAAARLRKAGVPDPENDSWRLLNYALPRSGQICGPSPADRIDDASANRFETFIAKREQRQPVSQIIGKRWFFGHEFEVNPDVLDPRPESETLVEAAIAASPEKVVDLGTGSGCLLLSVLARCPDAFGLGIDCCERALAVARRNAALIGCEDRSEFRQGDWLAGTVERFDVILANPPYVTETAFSRLAPEITRWEPPWALTPGGDGLDAYRAIATRASACLNSGGRLIAEIESDQQDSVAAIFAAGGLWLDDVHLDLDQRARALAFASG